METTRDKVLAVVFALGVHALAIGVLFVGLLWEPAPQAEAAEGPAIEAMLVSSPQQSATTAKAMAAAEKQIAEQKILQKQNATPPPQPKPEPTPQDAPQPQQLAPQARLPKPDTVNQDEVRRAAELAAEQKQLQEQDERRKQEQIDLTKQQQQQQQQEAENRQRLAQQQLVQQQQLEEIRKARAAAERDVKLKEEAMKQLQDQAARVAQGHAPPAAVAATTPPHPPAGSAGAGTDLRGKYVQAIKAVANENWHHENVPEKVHCIVQFKQLPGGEVFLVNFLDCPLDAAGRESVEAALKRTPLPYAGFESVFQPQGKIDMCYPEEACK